MKLPKPTKKQLALIIAGLLLTIIAAIWAGAAIPRSMSDGVERFEGEEQQAAQEAIGFIRDFYGSSLEVISGIGTFQYRVEAVGHAEIPDAGVYSDCASFYRVDISKLGLFGIVTGSTDRHVCIGRSTTAPETSEALH